MSRIRAILRKDARHLWVSIAVWWLLLVLLVLADASLPFSRVLSPLDYKFRVIVLVMLPVACWLLIGRLMLADAIVGDTQYWLGRPCTRGEVLTAKALFVALVILLPLALAHLLILGALHIPIGAYAGALLLRLFLFCVYLVLPPVVAGALTRNFRQYTGELLATVAVFYAVPLVWISLTHVAWRSDEWIRMCAMTLAVLLGSAITLSWLAWRRGVAGAWTAALLTLLAASLLQIPWGEPAQRMQSMWHGRIIVPRELTPQYVHAGPKPPGPDLVGAFRSVELQAPFVTQNVPAGLEYEVRGIQVDVETAHMKYRDPTASASQADGRVPSCGTEGALSRAGLVPMDGGKCAIFFGMPPETYLFNRDLLARVRVSIGFDLYERHAIDSPPAAGLFRVPGIGACTYIAGPAGDPLGLQCYSPFPRTSLHVAALHGATASGWSLLGGDEPGSPFPTSAGFSPIVVSSVYVNPGEPRRLLTERHVAQVVRELNLDNVMLRELRSAPWWQNGSVK